MSEGVNSNPAAIMPRMQPNLALVPNLCTAVHFLRFEEPFASCIGLDSLDESLSIQVAVIISGMNNKCRLLTIRTTLKRK